MANLLVECLEANLPPFTNVGMDYFGPLMVKRGRAEVKRYGVIFTCLVSRAVHLEVASSLDTDSAINAIRRFTARRGPVKHMRSDNGTNLVGAEKELSRSWPSSTSREFEIPYVTVASAGSSTLQQDHTSEEFGSG